MDSSDDDSSRCSDDWQQDARNKHSKGEMQEDGHADQLASPRHRRKSAQQNPHAALPDGYENMPQEADAEFQREALEVLLDIDQAVTALEREDLKIKSLHLRCQAEIRKFRVQKKVFASHLRILSENYQNPINNDKLQHPIVVSQMLLNQLQTTLSELRSAEETRRKFRTGDLLSDGTDSKGEACGATSSQGSKESQVHKGNQEPSESQGHGLSGEYGRNVQALQITLGIAQVLSSLEREGLQIRTQRKHYEDKIRNFTKLSMTLANSLVPFLEGMRIQNKNFYVEDPIPSPKRQKTEK